MFLLHRFRFGKRLFAIPVISKPSNLHISFPIRNIQNYAPSSSSTAENSSLRRQTPRRPAWLDQPLDKPRDAEKLDSDRERERFVVSSKASEKTNFLEFLEILKKRRQLPEWTLRGSDTGGESSGEYKSILYTAPFLAEIHGLQNEFADVAEEWFWRVRPLIANDNRRGEIAVSLQFSPNVDSSTKWRRSVTAIFNMAGQLEFLGRVNKATEGRLVENLGWRNVSYLTRRMMECGFFTFSFADVCNGALSGLRDLYHVYSPPSSIDWLTFSQGLRLWLTAMAHFLAAAESKPTEWRHLIGELNGNQTSVAAVLSRLRALNVSIIQRDPINATNTTAIFKYLTRLLCNFARIHCDDDIVEDCRTAMERGRLSTHLNVPRSIRFLNDFAVSWLRNPTQSTLPTEIENNEQRRIFTSPNFYLPGTWKSWFQACNVVATQLALTEEFFKESLSTGETENEVKEESRTLTNNSFYLRSVFTVRLLHNALEVALQFDESATFYEHIYETWIKLFRQMFDNKQRLQATSSLYREYSFMAAGLLRLAAIDGQRPIPVRKEEKEDFDDEENEDDMDAAVEKHREYKIKRKSNIVPLLPPKEPPQFLPPVWKKEHDDTIKLALYILKELDTADIPFRAMNDIVVALGTLKEIGKSDAIVSEKFLNILRVWSEKKLQQPDLSNRTIKSAQIIKETLTKLNLKPSGALKGLFGELEKFGQAKIN